MPNNYYDATGVLVLNKVTSVITALFGGFKLKPNYPGCGEAYIAKVAEDNATSWEEVLQGLRRLAADLGLSLPKAADETADAYLSILASHFAAENDDFLLNLIEQNDFEDDADFGTLFEIAKRLDDGHGLKALKIEGCWYCDKPHLFEFGGHGQYFGRHCSIDTESGWALSFGNDLDQALEVQDLDKCADLITQESERIFTSIRNDETREALRAKVAHLLLAKDVKHSRLKWYAITGRIPGDDEDSCLILQERGQQEALAAFKEEMWKDEPEAKRESVCNEYGREVFVTSIAVSGSPITYPS